MPRSGVGQGWLIFYKKERLTEGSASCWYEPDTQASFEMNGNPLNFYPPCFLICKMASWG